MKKTKKQAAIEILKSPRDEQLKIMLLQKLGYDLEQIVELALEIKD